jgi:hypothetical protein
MKLNVARSQRTVQPASHELAQSRFARCLQTGRNRDERLTELPTLYELMEQYKTTESDRRLADVVLLQYFRWPCDSWTCPDQFKILREGFAKTMSDPEL